MAIGWLSVLKLVPWGEVIDKGPSVAQGAVKLWQNVTKKPQPAPTPPAPNADSTPPALAEVQAQLAQLQQAHTELHQQMQDSSGLIKSLAEQNNQLIGQVERLRVRTRWLGAGLLALGVAVLVLYWRG